MSADMPWEIIVVDSDSNPDVKNAVRKYPDVKLIQSERGLHAGPARNLGVRASSGDSLAFIDADCIPGSRWLQSAYDELANGALMVGGPVLDALPLHPIASADNLLQFCDLGLDRPKGTVEVLPGCNLAVRKAVFETMNGFPDDKFIEDSLFTSAVAERWPDACIFAPAMQVQHKGRTTLKAFWCHQERFGYVRGFHGFRLKAHQKRLARRWVFVPLVIIKRLVYIFNRAPAWKLTLLIRNLLFLPLVVFGQLAWAVGFRRGCRDIFHLQQEIET